MFNVSVKIVADDFKGFIQGLFESFRLVPMSAVPLGQRFLLVS